MSNENFLSKLGSRYGINQTHPIRLQKRALLAALQFPYDPMLKRCEASHSRIILKYVQSFYTRGIQYVAIISERQPETNITPLFTVYSKNHVLWRNNKGSERVITIEDMCLIFQTYSLNTWIEFAPNPWRSGSIAGRLTYISVDSQILEMQKDTNPAKLAGDHKLPTYVGELCYIDQTRHRYIEDCRSLRTFGYEKLCGLSEVRSICRKMPSIASFEILRSISHLPTVEFAYSELGRMIVLDVDWPAQYLDQERIDLHASKRSFYACCKT